MANERLRHRILDSYTLGSCSYETWDGAMDIQITPPSPFSMVMGVPLENIPDKWDKYVKRMINE